MGRIGGRQQPLVVPLDRLLDGVGQLAAFLAVRALVLVGVTQLDAGLRGEHFDGADEVEVFDLADEGDGVAALAATKAFVEAELAVHVERRRLLVVERTEPDASSTDPLQLQVGADEIDQVGGFADPNDVLVFNAHSHLRCWSQSLAPIAWASASRATGTR